MLSYGRRLKYLVFGKEVLVRIDKNRLRSCSGLRWLVPLVYYIIISSQWNAAFRHWFIRRKRRKFKCNQSYLD